MVGTILRDYRKWLFDVGEDPTISGSKTGKPPPLSLIAQPKCILCPNPLTGQHRSGEHVIPNAIGGRLIIDYFICKACNDRTGYEWDSVLAAQLNGLCVMCEITRDRGEVQPHRVVTSAGETLELLPDGARLARPTFSKTETAEGGLLTLSTGTRMFHWKYHFHPPVKMVRSVIPNLGARQRAWRGRCESPLSEPRGSP